MEKNKKKANKKIIFKVSFVFEGNLNTLHTSNILQQKFKQKYRKKREVLQCWEWGVHQEFKNKNKKYSISPNHHMEM